MQATVAPLFRVCLYQETQTGKSEILILLIASFTRAAKGSLSTAPLKIAMRCGAVILRKSSQHSRALQP